MVKERGEDWEGGGRYLGNARKDDHSHMEGVSKSRNVYLVFIHIFRLNVIKSLSYVKVSGEIGRPENISENVPK